MKVLLIIAFFLVASSVADDTPSAQIAIPTKCEDVLSIKVCDKLKSAAKSLRLKVEVVTEAVQDAVRKGKSRVEEIYKSVEAFYLEKVKGKTCKDFVDKTTCAKLEQIGEKIQVAAVKTGEFVVKAMVAGKRKSEEIYNKVVEYYHEELKGKSCEQLLKSTKICVSLRAASDALKMKAEQFSRIIRETVMKSYNTTTSKIKSAVQKMKAFVVRNTKCEALLNTKLCLVLREYGTSMKIAFPKIMSTVVNLLVSGVKATAGFVKFVYKITDAFIDCEHFFTEESCKLLKEKITVVGGTLSDIGKAVRDITKKSITKATELYKTVVEYTKNKLCKHLGLKCPKVSHAISRRSPHLKNDLDEFKTVLKNGIAEAKKMLKQVAVDTMNALSNVDEKVRQIISNVIDKSSGSQTDMKKFLSEIMDIAASGNAGASGSKQDNKDWKNLRTKLVEALKNAHKDLKGAITFLINLSTDKLKKVASYAIALLKRIGKDGRTKRASEKVEMLEKAAEMLLVEEKKSLAYEMQGAIDKLLLNAIVEVLEDPPKHKINKRDVAAVDEQTSFAAKISSLIKQLPQLSLEDVKEAIIKEGMKFIAVLEDVYKLLHQD